MGFGSSFDAIAPTYYVRCRMLLERGALFRDKRKRGSRVARMPTEAHPTSKAGGDPD
jgi:hypothetical protein